MTLKSIATTDHLVPDKPFSGLNFQQDAYCYARMEGLSSTDAYLIAYKIEDREARYDVAAAAAKVERTPKVRQRLNEMIKERNSQISLVPQLNRTFVVNGVMEIAMHGNTDSVKLRALELLGKSAGIDLFRDVKATVKLERDPKTIDQELKEKLLGIMREGAVEGELIEGLEGASRSDASRSGASLDPVTIDVEPAKKDRRRKPKK